MRWTRAAKARLAESRAESNPWTQSAVLASPCSPPGLYACRPRGRHQSSVKPEAFENRQRKRGNQEERQSEKLLPATTCHGHRREQPQGAHNGRAVFFIQRSQYLEALARVLRMPRRHPTTRPPRPPLCRRPKALPTCPGLRLPASRAGTLERSLIALVDAPSIDDLYTMISIDSSLPGVATTCIGRRRRRTRFQGQRRSTGTSSLRPPLRSRHRSARHPRTERRRR